MSAPDDPDDRAPESSGSVDVSTSSSTAIPAQTSGSIEVAVSSSTGLPAVSSDGTPVPVGELDSAPVASGKIRAVVAGEQSGRTRRLTSAAKERLGHGVEKLGTGIGTIGEGVSKLGEKSRKVPLVGSSMEKLGEGISQMGESLHELPRVARTRRGRLLVRSLIVGFILVGTWISVIVALQLRTSKTPDYRPIAEQILLGLSGGPTGIEDVYDKASPRFHEMVRKERFIDDMNDLSATVGRFREITAVNDTLVSNGPTGRVGRVSLTVAYEKATCRASVSLHQDQGQWKLLGVGVELPPELEITQAQREERVQACKDPMSKSCELFVAASTILEQLRDGQSDAVWDDATQVFQKQEEKSRWLGIQAEHAVILGAYVRILRVTEAKMIGGTQASFDVITEYARSSGVRVIFGFYRRSKSMPWKLRSFKTVLPMPRADEQPVSPMPGVTVPRVPAGPVETVPGASRAGGTPSSAGASSGGSSRPGSSGSTGASSGGSSRPGSSGSTGASSGGSSGTGLSGMGSWGTDSSGSAGAGASGGSSRPSSSGGTGATKAGSAGGGPAAEGSGAAGSAATGSAAEGSASDPTP